MEPNRNEDDPKELAKKLMGKLTRSLEDVTHDEFLEVKNWLESSQVSTKAVRAHYACRYDTFKEAAAAAGVHIGELPRGGLRKYVSKELEDAVLNYKSDYITGYKRTGAALRKRGYGISDYGTRLIFEKEGLFCYEHEFKEKSVHTNRYAAKYANQLWHTDLHEWIRTENDGTRSKEYIIAFIDDRTRKILHLEKLLDKTMISTANALTHALSVNPVPHMLTIDNGTEFIGHEFQDVLNQNGITPHRTHPYTPEENSKIERWWRTLEQTIVHRDNLQGFVDEYNRFWPHAALKSREGNPLTPQEAWDSFEHYEGHDDLEIIYE